MSFNWGKLPVFIDDLLITLTTVWSSRKVRNEIDAAKADLQERINAIEGGGGRGDCEDTTVNGIRIIKNVARVNFSGTEVQPLCVISIPGVTWQDIGGTALIINGEITGRGDFCGFRLETYVRLSAVCGQPGFMGTYMLLGPNIYDLVPSLIEPIHDSIFLGFDSNGPCIVIRPYGNDGLYYTEGYTVCISEVRIFGDNSYDEPNIANYPAKWNIYGYGQDWFDNDFDSYGTVNLSNSTRIAKEIQEGPL